MWLAGCLGYCYHSHVGVQSFEDFSMLFIDVLKLCEQREFRSVFSLGRLDTEI